MVLIMVRIKSRVNLLNSKNSDVSGKKNSGAQIAAAAVVKKEILWLSFMMLSFIKKCLYFYKTLIASGCQGLILGINLNVLGVNPMLVAGIWYSVFGNWCWVEIIQTKIPELNH